MTASPPMNPALAARTRRSSRCPGASRSSVIQQRIGVAMLGAGFIADYHLAGLAACGRADVRAVVGRTAGRARAVAARHGVPHCGDDLAAVLDRPDVQAVVIATPDDTHEAVATAAAVAGKHILLQKPMAGSVPAARRIVAAAQRHGVDLQVSFMHRFFEEVEAARQFLADGALGRILAARIRNATPGPDWDAWFYQRAHVPNGVADQLAVHGIDLVRFLLGPIVGVNALARTALPVRTLRDGRKVTVEVVDNVVATYTLADGTLVTHEVSQTEIAGCDRFRFEIYGEEGTLWLRGERGALALYAPARHGAVWHVPTLPACAPGARQHAVWLAGIAGDQPRLATADDALHGMQVIAAMLRSIAQGGARESVEDAS